MHCLLAVGEGVHAASPEAKRTLLATRKAHTHRPRHACVFIYFNFFSSRNCRAVGPSHRYLCLELDGAGTLVHDIHTHVEVGAVGHEARRLGGRAAVGGGGLPEARVHRSSRPRVRLRAVLRDPPLGPDANQLGERAQGPGRPGAPRLQDVLQAPLELALKVQSPHDGSLGCQVGEAYPLWGLARTGRLLPAPRRLHLVRRPVRLRPHCARYPRLQAGLPIGRLVQLGRDEERHADEHRVRRLHDVLLGIAARHEAAVAPEGVLGVRGDHALQRRVGAAVVVVLVSLPVRLAHLRDCRQHLPDVLLAPPVVGGAQDVLERQQVQAAVRDALALPEFPTGSHVQVHRLAHGGVQQQPFHHHRMLALPRDISGPSDDAHHHLQGFVLRSLVCCCGL
mmetsp:Transcript_27513/g.60102  ORF Transcript_27513/g.60102 Transcript_27513/m.60102 type:complete len:394 (-) Transcript_27513:1481-2662(-)